MVLGTEAGIRLIVQGLCSSYNFLSSHARLIYLRLTPFVIFHALRIFSVLCVGGQPRSDGMGDLLSNARACQICQSPIQGTYGFQRALKSSDISIYFLNGNDNIVCP